VETHQLIQPRQLKYCTSNLHFLLPETIAHNIYSQLIAHSVSNSQSQPLHHQNPFISHHSEQNWN